LQAGELRREMTAFDSCSGLVTHPAQPGRELKRRDPEAGEGVSGTARQALGKPADRLAGPGGLMPCPSRTGAGGPQ
jgi:hypothetical protein